MTNEQASYDEASFGSHSTGRPKQIKRLIALLTAYWRLNPELQLHELLSSLTPGDPLVLDGLDRDDATLISLLQSMPDVMELFEQ
jgi:hypothetical protein